MDVRGSVSIDDWAGQTIHVVFEADDGGADNLVEAGVDDVRIRLPARQMRPGPPVADLPN